MTVKPIAEAVIQADIILEVSRIFPDSVTIWRNNTGALMVDGRLVRYGLTGQADISGIIKPLGTRLEIEVKRSGGRQSTSQKLFDKMIKRHGGLYLLCDGDIDEQVIEPIRELIERNRKVVR